MSVEGWIAIVAFAGTMAVPVLNLQPGNSVRYVWIIAGILGCFLICILKGTPPGGPKQRTEFDHLRQKAELWIRRD